MLSVRGGTVIPERSLILPFPSSAVRELLDLLPALEQDGKWEGLTEEPEVGMAFTNSPALFSLGFGGAVDKCRASQAVPLDSIPRLPQSLGT